MEDYRQKNVGNSENGTVALATKGLQSVHQQESFELIHELLMQGVQIKVQRN